MAIFNPVFPAMAAVEFEVNERMFPLVKELAVIAAAFPVVEGAVTDNVPFEMERPPLPSTVNPATVDAAFESKPDVIVTCPDIVGIAVQAVPVTERSPPNGVNPVPTVKVLDPVTDVAPFKDIAPVPVEN